MSISDVIDKFKNRNQVFEELEAQDKAILNLVDIPQLL